MSAAEAERRGSNDDLRGVADGGAPESPDLMKNASKDTKLNQHADKEASENQKNREAYFVSSHDAALPKKDREEVVVKTTTADDAAAVSTNLPPINEGSQSSSQMAEEDRRVNRAETGTGHIAELRCEKPLSESDGEAERGGVDLRQMMAHWARSTSISAVSRIADEAGEKTWWYRLFWAFLMVFCTGCMIQQIVELISEYQKYNVTTDTKTVHPPAVEFPDVTVCGNKLLLPNLSPRNLPGYELDSPRDLSDFIVSTQFNSVNIENLTQHWTPSWTNFGHCFTFRTTEQVYFPGIVGGLSFEANLSDTEGALIFVVERGMRVSHQTPFAVAWPQKTTVLKTEATVLRRVREAPWARCKGEAPTYSSLLCREDCLNRLYRDKCDCRVCGDDTEPDLAFCASNLAAWFDCRATLNETEALDKCDCSVPACKETRYTVDSSAEVDMSQPDGVASPLVSVRVNFPSIRYVETTEHITMTRTELLAAIGGVMGLFLGISVPSLVEIADLFLIRLVPRCFGVRGLHGLGGKQKNKR